MAKDKTLPTIILIAIILGVGFWSYSAYQKNSDNGVFNRAKQENTFDSYMSYLKAYPEGKHEAEVGDAMTAIVVSTPFEDLKDLLRTIDRQVPNKSVKEKCHKAIEEKVNQEYNKANKTNTVASWNYFIKNAPSEYVRDGNTKYIDAAYAEAKKTNTIVGWKNYKSLVGTSNYRDADKRIEDIEARQWKNESNAWQLASSEKTIAAYNKYLKFHPNGSHASTARKRIIDLEVDGIFAGSHGTLPSMDRTYYGYSSTSSVTIHNGTGYTLTIYYSGNTSKKVSIPAGQTTSFSMPNGEYRVAASVSSASVRSYAGRESLTGGGYEADYYISTSRY